MSEATNNAGGRRGFLDRTLSNLRTAWQSIAGSAYDAETASLRPDLPETDMQRLRQQMRACLETRGGEVSARARAAALGRAYLALDGVGRGRFLTLLAQDFDVDRRAVDDAMEALRASSDGPARMRAEAALRQALEPPRVRLLTQFNALPDGIKFLVDLRAELMPLARRDPILKYLDQDLQGLLSSWFDVDFLELRRITWDTASAASLEKLIAYEAVHAIQGWEDLKNRLDSDRRCFAYFHPRMPDEPLIFVEVALINGMASSVQDLLDETAPVVGTDKANTAIFYSISNCQRGLNGISFGGFLIKRVVDRLSEQSKGLKTFATLSPIPGFRAWLDDRLAEEQAGLLTPTERKAVMEAGGGTGGAKGRFKALVEAGTWAGEPKLSAALKGPLMRLCARYLLEEMRDDGKPLDPVARFHLANGARMERLNWLGDTSANGLAQSMGMMINYLYKQSDIEENHEAYTARGKITASSGIRNLV